MSSRSFSTGVSFRLIRVSRTSKEIFKSTSLHGVEMANLLSVDVVLSRFLSQLRNLSQHSCFRGSLAWCSWLHLFQVAWKYNRFNVGHIDMLQLEFLGGNALQKFTYG